MAYTYTPLASVAQFEAFGSMSELIQNSQVWTAPTLATLMVAASRKIETRCRRRLVPFGTLAGGSPLVETTRAEGVDPDGFVLDDLPLDLQGALGRSKSQAFGVTRLVRDFWLEQYPPAWSELWSYVVDHVELDRAYGDSEIVQPTQLELVTPDTGHFRLRLGTFCPPGTTVRFFYSGGYSPVPEDLSQACVFEAAKSVLIGAEPEMRGGLDTKDLDQEIFDLIQIYVRS